MLWNVLRWPVILVFLTVALAPVYYWAPDVAQAWRWITPGAVCAILATLSTSLGFSYYVTKFAAYDATYGSIGAVIVLLTWMYLTGLFILVGGEANAELAHTSAAGKPRERMPPEKNCSARRTNVSVRLRQRHDLRTITTFRARVS